MCRGLGVPESTTQTAHAGQLSACLLGNLTLRASIKPRVVSLGMWEASQQLRKLHFLSSFFKIFTNTFQKHLHLKDKEVGQPKQMEILKSKTMLSYFIQMSVQEISTEVADILLQFIFFPHCPSHFMFLRSPFYQHVQRKNSTALLQSSN